MRVPWSWLLEYCDPGLGVDELAERLSMTGTEVERVSHVGAPSTHGYVVGRVLAADAHPNADRLSVCQVDTGDGVRTIVCGAPNVAGGQAVPVALPGALLPDGRELGRAKLRGVVSDGMILSEAELGIGDDADGIAVLGDGLPGEEQGEAPAAQGLDPGRPLGDVLPIAEPVLELEVTPNRVDCLSVYGIAREVHAITGSPLAPAPWEQDAEAGGSGRADELASVAVEAPELCPRFTARVFTGVEPGPSPLWLKARLIAAGQRPISNVVDITNYVMLLTAQPLHAFDLDRVPGGALIVRTAAPGERIVTLDGAERELHPDTVVVCDREGPSGIAGIMGGRDSEVSPSTTRVLLEVATWNGPNILRTSSRLAVRSEASARFEKQLHPELAMRAQRLASRLIVELCRAELVPGTIDVAAEAPAPQTISLHGLRLAGLLGMEVSAADAGAHLERLGFAVDADAAGDERDYSLRATTPPDRYFDVMREVDLIEEVARLHGLETLPATLPAHGERAGALRPEQRLRRRAEDALRDLGFDEIVAWSFHSPELADRLRLPADDPRRKTARIHNPLSEEQSEMRATLLGGLLDAARHDLAHDIDRVALFESGRAYLHGPAPDHGGELAGSFPGRLPPPMAEPHRLAALVVGPIAPGGWRRSEEPAGFFELKGVLEDLCALLGAELRVQAAPEPFLHPGRSARIELLSRAGEASAAAGWIGELHPLVARAWDLPGGVAFELELAALVAAAATGREQYEDVVSFPAARQDIAVTVPDEVPAERVREAVLDGGGDLLRAARVFDLYRGEQVGEGRKSLALRLEFRAPDRTLTDAEVGERRQAITEALAEIGGSLRE